MAIRNVLITGDAHGLIEGRLNFVKREYNTYVPEETAVIFLGDFCINYGGGKYDYPNKRRVAEYGYNIYALRGNHEMRASNVKSTELVYDKFVHGDVYVEKDFPNIRYFRDDVTEYNIMGNEILCIPGAYSVDKWYRLQRGSLWFEDEQLTADEMAYADREYRGRHYEFVFSHTCPLSFQPTDLFLRGLDQSTVDNTMEVWLESFKDKIEWKYWLFGHYHADRIERPYVEQFCMDVVPLHSIIERWERYRKTGELDWWLTKSPNFYWEV